MKTKYTLFRRGEMFYMQDSATGKQTSLHTKDETEAKSLLEARNAAQRQPVLNLHLARAYLTASDPAFVERTWQVVMEQMQSRGKESSRERYASVFKRRCRLLPRDRAHRLPASGRLPCRRSHSFPAGTQTQ